MKVSPNTGIFESDGGKRMLFFLASQKVSQTDDPLPAAALAQPSEGGALGGGTLSSLETTDITVLRRRVKLAFEIETSCGA